MYINLKKASMQHGMKNFIFVITESASEKYVCTRYVLERIRDNDATIFEIFRGPY